MPEIIKSTSKQPVNIEKTCCVCNMNQIEMIVLPCSHMCLCESCSNKYIKSKNDCPMCRKVITTIQRVYT